MSCPPFLVCSGSPASDQTVPSITRTCSTPDKSLTVWVYSLHRHEGVTTHSLEPYVNETNHPQASRSNTQSKNCASSNGAMLQPATMMTWPTELEPVQQSMSLMSPATRSSTVSKTGPSARPCSNQRRDAQELVLDLKSTENHAHVSHRSPNDPTRSSSSCTRRGSRTRKTQSPRRHRRSSKSSVTSGTQVRTKGWQAPGPDAQQLCTAAGWRRVPSRALRPTALGR